MSLYYIVFIWFVYSDWNATRYSEHGQIPVPPIDYKFVLPFVMEFLTPLPVAVIGLGAVSAAVMSSADSAILSASSMFAINVYTPIKNKILTGKTNSKPVRYLHLLEYFIFSYVILSSLK